MSESLILTSFAEIGFLFVSLILLRAEELSLPFLFASVGLELALEIRDLV